MIRVLLVEDNKDLAFALTQAMLLEGYDVELVTTGEAAISAASNGTAALIVLDIMLPDIDGFRVLRSIRDAKIETPVLVLTARAEEEDKLRGFELGADDYLTKPFGVRELLARCNALLRRRDRGRGEQQQASIVTFGDVEVSRSARLVRRAGAPVTLRPKELDLLLALVAKAGEVVTRQELLSNVWGYTAGITTRTVDIHMVELRKKLERDPAEPRHIVTVRKAGYRLDLATTTVDDRR